MLMKKILIVLLVVVLAAAGVGWYMWNKPPETVEGKKATAIDAETLSKAFTDNEQKANATYLNQVLDVTGTVTEVSKNQDGKTVVLLQVSDPLSGIQCTMRDDQVKAAPGQSITIKGFCNGYTLVVLLSDCIVK
jgi:uncharacterized protein YxeA